MNTQTTAAVSTTPRANAEGATLLEISDAVREVREDWLYQLCGPEAREQLLRERVPALDLLRPTPALH